MALGNQFNQLTINVASAAAGGVLRSLNGSNPLVKYNVVRPYASSFFDDSHTSLLVFEGKRLIEQQLYETVNTIIPKMIKSKQKEIRMERDTELKETNEAIIENGHISTGDTTKFKTSDDKLLYATDIYGRSEAAVGAIFLAYTSDTTIGYELYGETKNVDSKDVVVWDPAPSVSANSKKNLQVTPVVGRDYSRKELISNSDVSFSVSGKFVSRNPDVYPTNEVKRFIDIMRHQDIIRVQNLSFSQHNVEYIVIQDYNLPTPTCLNEQPYSFTCIGVEPNDEKLTQDTLSAQFYTPKTSKLEGWYNNILSQYMLSQAGAVASQGIATASSSLNSLIR